MKPSRNPVEEMVAFCAVGFVALGALFGLMAEGSTLTGGFMLGGLLAAAFGLYLVPSMVGMNRNRERAGGVVVVNVFLGWTLLGWVGALAWAMALPLEEAAPAAEPKKVEPPAPKRPLEDVETDERGRIVID